MLVMFQDICGVLRNILRSFEACLEAGVRQFESLLSGKVS